MRLDLILLRTEIGKRSYVFIYYNIFRSNLCLDSLNLRNYSKFMIKFRMQISYSQWPYKRVIC